MASSLLPTDVRKRIAGIGFVPRTTIELLIPRVAFDRAADGQAERETAIDASVIVHGMCDAAGNVADMRERVRR